MLSKLLYLVRKPMRVISAMRAGEDANAERYIRHAPHPQNAVAIFRDLWWSQFPPEFGVVAGRLPLFWDARVKWAIEAFGGVQDKSILELGPLEGGHTYMMERAGARSILAVEGDAHSYLRCLIAKEIVNLQRARFVLGDFEVYLRETKEHFDAALASGVLYHVMHPVELIHHLARVSNQVYLWTHYYDEERLRRNKHMAHRFAGGEPAEWEGFHFTAHRYAYGDFLKANRFAGGSGQYSVWLTRDDLLGALRIHGLTEIAIGMEEPDHPNGPAIMLVAAHAGKGAPTVPPYDGSSSA